MAFNHFVQTLWSAKIQKGTEEQCKLVKDCTRAYEGEVEHGRTVKILAVGDPTIGNYIGQEIEFEDMKSSSQDLTIDVQKYFGFDVPDIDKAQSVPGLPEEYQRKSVKKLAITREKFIGALVAGKAQSSEEEEKKSDVYKEGAVNIIVATNKTKAAIRAAFDAALVKLRENNFDESGVIEMTPADYSVFKGELIDIKTSNDDLISRGVVGTYDDYEAKSTNNIYRDADYSYAIVRSKRAIAFVGQINSVEAGRREKKFSDYIKGLDVYGAKIIAQDELVVVKIPLLVTA